MNFTIAGLETSLEIEGEISDSLKETLDYYKDFSCSSSDRAFRIKARTEEGEVFIKPVPGPWEVRTQIEGERMRFTSYLEQGWFNLTRGEGELVLRPKGNPENYLRHLYGYRCLDHNALLLHAGGVIRNEAAYVFFGPSTSGKSTAISLSSGSAVLSDDIVLLKIEGNEQKKSVRAYGVPFRGTYIEAPRTNASAVVRRIYRLQKASEHRVEDLTSSKAVSELSASIPFVMSQPANAMRALQISQMIVNTVPVVMLYFRKDAGFWDIIA